MSKERTMKLRLSTWMISIFLAAVFVVAASAKISGYENFQVTLVRSQLLGKGYESMVAPLTIGIELAIAVALLIPKLRPFAVRAMGGLCCVFISYSAWRWARHISVPCSCFGALFRMTPPQAIALNLGLLGLATLLLRLQESLMDSPKPRLESKPEREGGMLLKT